MPRRFEVDLIASATLTMQVELDDEDIEDLDEEEIRELARDRAAEEGTGRNTLCVHCTGYGQDWTVDIAEFEPSDDEDHVRER